MWQKIDGFSDYLISDKGLIYRISTKQLQDKAVVSLKNDTGLWLNKSTKKLKRDIFGSCDKLLIATPVIAGEQEMVFTDIAEAAIWLIQSKRAITAGRLAAFKTICTNIKHGIKQPELYPYIYGYSWRIEERSYSEY